MKKALTLVFIYLGMQILGAFLALLLCGGYLLFTGGDFSTLQNMSITPSLFLAIVMMTIYLWKFGYISSKRSTWSIVSPAYVLITLVASFSGIWLLEMLMSYLSLPDLMANTFDLIQTSWIGILSITILGPILEELLFRGAITKALLQQYRPNTAIFLSALLFGVVHVNPNQVVGAFLIGLLLAWMYYKTASLIPCIIIHIINNSLSVYLALQYPEMENLNDSFEHQSQALLLTLLFGALFIGSLLVMKRTRVVGKEY